MYCRTGILEEGRGEVLEVLLKSGQHTIHRQKIAIVGLNSKAADTVLGLFQPLLSTARMVTVWESGACMRPREAQSNM